MVDVTIDRDKYIGGSDLPTILGYNKKYNKPIIDFAREKLNIIPNTFKGNEYTKYGQLMEHYVRNFINEMYNTNFVPDTAIDEKRKLRGNCDGFDSKKKILLEVKTFHGRLKVDYYTPQCQMYMELFNCDECWLVGYNRPTNFYSGVDYTLEKDDIYFDTTFDESNIIIYKINRDKEKWNKIEIEIEKFKYLLNCLKEEMLLNVR